jgi:hypothetical protein
MLCVAQRQVKVSRAKVGWGTRASTLLHHEISPGEDVLTFRKRALLGAVVMGFGARGGLERSCCICPSMSVGIR